MYGRFEHVRASYTRKHTGALLLRYTCRLCATHSDRCVRTAVHAHTAVTMLSAQRINSAVYTPAFTCDGKDLYRRSAGGRWGSMAGSNTYAFTCDGRDLYRRSAEGR